MHDMTPICHKSVANIMHLPQICGKYLPRKNLPRKYLPRIWQITRTKFNYLKGILIEKVIKCKAAVSVSANWIVIVSASTLREPKSQELTLNMGKKESLCQRKRRPAEAPSSFPTRPVPPRVPSWHLSSCARARRRLLRGPPGPMPIITQYRKYIFFVRYEGSPAENNHC